MMTVKWTITAALVAVGLLCAPLQAQDRLRTLHEESGYTEYTPYDSMMDYLGEVRAQSAEMTLSSYGESYQGRTLPVAIFSRPRITEPWEAWTLGRPVVLFNASVHGDEPTLRESLLVLIRELATPGSVANALLDHLVILVAPQINPDGFEAPGGSTRGNSWGIDMNRDWVKLEQPALAAYATRVVGRWRPDVVVDGHNGGSLPYSLTYQCPSHAESDPRITLLCDEGIFPAVDARLAAEGMKSFFYARGNHTRWDGGGYDARIGRNYSGFVNSVGILFESPQGVPPEQGTRAGVLGFMAVAEWVRDHGDALRETVRRARIETIEMGTKAEGEVVTAMEYGPEEASVTYEIFEASEDQRSLVEITSDSLMKRPVVTASRPRPFAYLLPRAAVGAVALLRRHGISVERLDRPVRLKVDAYVLASVAREQAYNHSGAVRVEVAESVTRETSFPEGTFVVQTGQMLGRLVAHMLEPETNDNVIYWNTMDAWLPEAQLADPNAEGEPILPIYKLMSRRPLPATLIR
jgi:dipeptidyl-peptidase 4